MEENDNFVSQNYRKFVHNQHPTFCFQSLIHMPSFIQFFSIQSEAIIMFKVLLYSVLPLTLMGVINSLPAQPFNTGGIRSDVITTQWTSPSEKNHLKDEEQEQPGWMKRQLMNFGKAASRVGNMMGSHATKISVALDKICEVIKTVIPLLAAVCHVGQFGFCAATNDVPADLSAAISPAVLSELDR